jgi:thiol-disulfide isomerase/thioredoxin
VILDFWHQRCLSCIEAFPKIDSLQKAFGGRVQFILVNTEGKDSTKRFFEKRKRIKAPDVPIVTGDKALRRLFPHVGEPYHVWIDEQGFVRYKTGDDHTSYLTIDSFFKGLQPRVPLHQDKQNIRSLFDSQWSDKIEYYSYIARCLPNSRIIPLKEPDGYEYLTVSCASIYELYKQAYNGNTPPAFQKFNNNNRVILEARDPAKYVNYKNPQNWLTENGYSYQLLLPKKREGEKYEIMKQDLGRYFSLDAKVETRSIKCLVLIRTSDKDKLKTAAKATKDNFLATSLTSTEIDSLRYFLNQPFEEFSKRVGYLAEYNFSLPFIDATGYTGNIDLVWDGNILDYPSLEIFRKTLQEYDLDLVEMFYPLEVLVLKER